jgi:molybdopterin synthase sulfur carrier subunit
MTRTVRIPCLTVEGATVGEALDNLEAAYPGLKGCLRDEQGSIAPFVSVFVDGKDVRRLDGLNTPVDGADLSIVPAAAGGLHRSAPSHPINELRAARRDLLAALQGCTAADLLRSGVEGDWCGRDVLLHIVAWLRELAHLVPDLANYGYQHGEPCDPGPDWSAWNAAQIAPHRTARPEAAVAGVVTAHARLLEVVEGLDDASLRRRGPTRFGFETSGWDLLVAEATHEREHAARLAAHACRPARARDPPCHQPSRVLHTSRV